MKTIRQKSFYTTQDLSLAAAISLLFPIETIDKTNPRKATFVFKQSKNLEGMVDSYWRDELKVNPRAYFDKLRSIKSRLYAGR
ncbi:MAG TPA: DUF5659 domain-containing protein [Candidatus Bathyarchaeia archaeon]|nr:DUF5659 domain-containing protein [Candidatus Bathyarchaeia archaeon]